MATESTELLTLHEAADRLGVHYMTVYRRVRLGMLTAHKVGGQWRVDPADLVGPWRAAAGRRARATDETPSGPGRTARSAGRPPAWPELAGDVAGSWQLVEAAMAAGVEPADVYVDILGPAMHDIGDGWQRGDWGSIRSTWPRGCAVHRRPHGIGSSGGRRLGTVLVAMPTGERHAGAAMLADILAWEGYEVLNLGADTPPASSLRGGRSGRPARGRRHRRRQHRRRPPREHRRPAAPRRTCRDRRRICYSRCRDRSLDRRRRLGRRSARSRPAHRDRTSSDQAERSPPRRSLWNVGRSLRRLTPGLERPAFHSPGLRCQDRPSERGGSIPKSRPLR